MGIGGYWHIHVIMGTLLNYGYPFLLGISDMYLQHVLTNEYIYYILNKFEYTNNTLYMHILYL